MKRKHLIILALMIGTSAALGVSLIAGAVPLGMRAHTDAPQRSSMARDRQINQREAMLARAERQLARMAARRPPALPDVPDRIPPARGGGMRAVMPAGQVPHAPAPPPDSMTPVRSSAPPVSSAIAHDDDLEHEGEHESDHHEEDHGEYEDD